MAAKTLQNIVQETNAAVVPTYERAEWQYRLIKRLRQAMLQ